MGTRFTSPDAISKIVMADSVNLVPRVFSLSNMAAAGEKTPGTQRTKTIADWCIS